MSDYFNKAKKHAIMVNQLHEKWTQFKGKVKELFKKKKKEHITPEYEITSENDDMIEFLYCRILFQIRFKHEVTFGLLEYNCIKEVGGIIDKEYHALERLRFDKFGNITDTNWEIDDDEDIFEFHYKILDEKLHEATQFVYDL
jgi:hypothetical protein